MTNDNWKTPLGYYERAIAELSKVREEFQMELQTIREVQASQADLKEQLQVTKEQLDATQKTANEFQSRVATAEKAANDAQSELQSLKENLQPIRLESGVFSGNVKITPGWSGVLCCDRNRVWSICPKLHSLLSTFFKSSPNSAWTIL